MFKIANNTKPTTNWGDLIASDCFSKLLVPPRFSRKMPTSTDNHQTTTKPSLLVSKMSTSKKEIRASVTIAGSLDTLPATAGVLGIGKQVSVMWKEKVEKVEKVGKVEKENNGAPRGGKGGKGYQGNKGWKSNKETSYAGGDDEVHTCFVLNDSNPSSDAPTHVTIRNSAMNLLLGKDDDDGEVELKTTQARGETLATYGRMGARSPQRRSYSILSSQPTPPPPHPHQFTTQSELWLVKVLRERRRRREQPQQEEATRATVKEERKVRCEKQNQTSCLLVQKRSCNKTSCLCWQRSCNKTSCLCWQRRSNKTLCLC